ncbi:MAG: hypothetical protein ISR52_10305 [Rhodospirillales bacterium]|nr:hypothetical protein [Rhodospirillales bacterium]
MSTLKTPLATLDIDWTVKTLDPIIAACHNKHDIAFEFRKTYPPHNVFRCGAMVFNPGLGEKFLLRAARIMADAFDSGIPSLWKLDQIAFLRAYTALTKTTDEPKILDIGSLDACFNNIQDLEFKKVTF